MQVVGACSVGRPWARHRGVWLALAWLLLTPGLLAAQRASVTGRVVEERTGRAVAGASVSLVGHPATATTDSTGLFSIATLQPGVYVLEVRHIAHGVRSVEITVRADGPTRLQVTVTETAIELAPLQVDVLSREQRDTRGSGVRRSRVTRDQIADARGTNLDLAELLRLHLPGVRVRRLERVLGNPICIETRAIREMNAGSCLSPAVYLDGVPIANPTTLYGALPIESIESMELIPASEAGVRFGTGAMYGALLIETRRPGSGGRQALAGQRAEIFQWTSDPSGHATGRVLASSTVGNAVGLGVGVWTARQCLHLRAPSNDGLVSRCDAIPTIAAAAAALVLPAISSSVASGLAGRTPISKGRVLPAAVAAAMVVLPGYALVLTGERNQSAGLRNTGYGILLLGTPLVSTWTDYLFRQLRGEEAQTLDVRR